MTHFTHIASLLPLSLPLLFLAGAAASRWSLRWQAAQTLSALALAAMLLAAGAAVAAHLADDAGLWQATPLLSLSAPSLAIAVLVAFLGLVIVRYSRNYLSGEPRQARYLAMLQATLAAVAAVVLTNHLLVLLAAWIAISLGLHQLLLFYPERPRAALAAHKKFLFARTAECSLLAAILLLAHQHGTWLISEIVEAYPRAQLTPTDQLAALLLAVAALIKCAQLPAHGWLIQVVEAPTPVSALLHAGIINLGGYLLILFAPLLVQATAAQWLILVVGGLTTVLASLVMTTRVSVKVRLAWSTSAQMGLMLVECALGLYELALLHLLAHACYKAYGFLNAGSALEQDLAHRLAGSATPDIGDWLRAWGAALGLALLIPWAAGIHGPWSLWLLMAAALSVVLADRNSRYKKGTPSYALGLAGILLLAYSVQKFGAGALIDPVTTSAGWAADAWVALLVLVLSATWAFLRIHPESRWSQRLARWLFAGFYLDEWVTRTTLRVWPTSLPVRIQPKTLALLTKETVR